MEIVLDMGHWCVNDEYFITEGVYGYEVHTFGSEDEESKEVYSNETFEGCLTWIWNSR